jgi:hypothetical protein
MSKKEKCRVDAKTKYREIFDKKQKVLAELDPKIRRKFLDEGVEILPFKASSVDEVADMIDDLRHKYKNPSEFRSKAKEAIDSMKSERINKKIDFFEKHLTDMSMHEEIFTNSKNLKDALNKFENLFDVTLDHSINHNISKNMNVLSQTFDKAQLKILETNDPTVIKTIYDTIDNKFKDDVDPNIKAIGMGIRKFWDYLYNQQVDAGFRLGHLSDYTGNRSYNGEKLRLNRTQALIDYRKKINVAESFPDLDLRDPVDLAKFEKITAKIIDSRIEADIYGSTIDIGKLDTSGRSNLEARQTRERKIVFNKGEEGDWAVNYGSKSLLENMVAQARTVGKVSATRKVLGVNPRATTEKLLNTFKEKSVDVEPKIFEKVSHNNYHKKMWAPYDGTLDKLAGSASVAQFFANAKAVIYMSKLGKTTISAQADIPNAAIALDVYTGQGILKSTADIVAQAVGDSPDAMKAYVTGKIPVHIQKRAGELGIFWTNAMGEFLKKAGIDGQGSRGFQKLMNINERVNPVAKQTAFHDMMAVMAYQNAAAKILKSNSPELDISLKRARLEDPAYKKMLIASIDELSLDKFNAIVFSPQKVYNVDDAIAQATKDKIAMRSPKVGAMSLEEFKADTADRVQVMFHDFRNNAIPKPGGKQQRILNFGMKGTVLGELASSLLILKSFAFKMLEVNARIMESTGGDKSKMMKRFGSFYLQMTMMGYAIISLKALTSNETPPPLDSIDTLLNAVVAGGAGGLYADLFLSATDEQYNNFVTGSLGPIAGATQQAFITPINKLIRGDAELKDAKGVTRLTPIVNNHFLIRPALDYLILDSVDKAVDPAGYRRRYRMLRRKDKDKLYTEGAF